MKTKNESGLIRAVGMKEIIALTINGIIGAGIFALPATAAKILGIASPIAFVIAGVFALLIVLCFAELGGMYDRTGGAYLYAVEAFGGVTAFQVGWMYFLARVTSIAALSNALAGFVGYFVHAGPPFREILIIVTLALLGLVNYIGIRFSSRLIDFLTAAKLIPLLIFIVAGLILMRWNIFSGASFPPVKPLTQAVLILIFAFSGFEVIAIPGAEMIDPRRELPIGILIGTVATILIYVLIQIVAVASLPNISRSAAPLAESATALMGIKGGALLTAGAICSTIGTLTSLLLVAPRILYAMALNRQMPELLSRIHHRFATPFVAIAIVTLLEIGVSLIGSFGNLAALSAIARLLTYIGSAAALLILRRKKPSTNSFRAPGGLSIPVIAIVLAVFFLTAMTRIQVITGTIALGVGLFLYAIARMTTTEPTKL